MFHPILPKCWLHLIFLFMFDSCISHISFYVPHFSSNLPVLCWYFLKIFMRYSFRSVFCGIFVIELYWPTCSFMYANFCFGCYIFGSSYSGSTRLINCQKLTLSNCFLFSSCRFRFSFFFVETFMLYWVSGFSNSLIIICRYLYFLSLLWLHRWIWIKKVYVI